MSYTNFCCRAGGNDLNAGTVDGSETEPGVNPLVTYTSGDWDGTSVYTAPVGADMTAAQVGRFASIYVDGISAAASGQWMHARITAVNAGTRQVTVSTTARSLFGTIVTSGTGNRSMRIGGAWAGATGDCFTPVQYDLERLLKCSESNRQVESEERSDLCSNEHWIRRRWCRPGGYSSTYMDGGIAEIQGPASGSSIALWFIGTLGGYTHDLCFNGNGTTFSQVAIQMASNTPSTVLRRIIVKNMRVLDSACRNSL